MMSRGQFFTGHGVHVYSNMSITKNTHATSAPARKQSGFDEEITTARTLGSL